jgi:hypothetical protein
LPTNADFNAVFHRLRGILQEHAGHLLVAADEPENYSLNVPRSEWHSQELFFGAVKVGKRYVSYHLMPIYARPELLTCISPELKQRMQGKSCFNFTRIDEPLLAELSALTQQGIEAFQDDGLGLA